MPAALPEPWLAFFNELDDIATAPVTLHCIGGFVVSMLYGLQRPTADVDVLPHLGREPSAAAVFDAARNGGVLHRKYAVYIDVVTVVQPPYNYEDRLVEMFAGTFKNLHLMALDPYDLALTKLPRNIERDREDVRSLARFASFDLGVLEQRYTTELREYLTGPHEREDRTLRLWREMIEEDRASIQ
jgi:hypothetical protein